MSELSVLSILREDEKVEGAFFNIDGYYFYRLNGIHEYRVMEHDIHVNLGNKQLYLYKDVISILRDIDQSPVYTNVDPNKKEDEQDVYIKWLTDSPKGEYEYIRDFESKIYKKDEILFHDFMKEYIEICKFKDANIDCSIVFIGYTLIDNNFEIKIKAFNYKILNNISKKIAQQFSKHKFIVKSDNLNWLRLDEFIVEDNAEITSPNGNKLLINTLKPSMGKIFEYLFKKIDKEGYIDLKIDEKKDKKEEAILKNLINNKKQLYGLLKPYLKLFINNQFMYLHDETALDLKDEKNNRIFSFSPRLMQYYQKQWFEDFIGEILMIIKDKYKGFSIKSTMRNKIFNFYKDGDNSHNIEIDWIIDVEKGGVNRTIGIECKKTLKKNYNKATRDKVYTKIVESGKAIVDGYLIVGYFKEAGFLGDMILSSQDEYKPSIIFNEDEYSDEDVFIQYLSICDTDIKDIQNKIIKCIEIIYKNS
ncbi:hypothetical protein [Clostridium akagii]|uniref:hypothetical protein n=1 Tax=Clostridium akagii TaxID=91623 RepID=UPI00047905D4|nr:hypothetical protein [Clostridium akagii]